MVELRTQSQPNPTHKPQIFTPPPFDPSLIQELSFKSTYTNSVSTSRSNRRLFKVRRNSSHPKPPPPPSFNTFRSEKIDEKLERWNPFVPAGESGRPRVPSGTNFDAGKTFVFGSGSGNSGSSRESSLGSDEGSVFSNLSNLPDEMRRKLDLRSNKDENVEASSTSFARKGNCAKNSADLGGNFDERSFSKLNLNDSSNVGGSSDGDGGSVSSGSKGSGFTGSFVFPSGVKKGIDSSGFYEGLFCNLSDEMRKKMSLSNRDDMEEKRRAENVFVFGSNQNATGSCGVGTGNKGSKNESVGCEQKDLFGSGVMKGADSNEGLFSKLPDEMRKKMNLSSGDGVEEKKRADNVFVFGSNQSQTGSFGVGITSNELNNESVGCKENVDESNGFVFRSSGSAPAFGGIAVNMLHDNMQKMKIGTEKENKSNLGSIPSSPEFTFTGSNMNFKTPNQDASRLTRESLFTGTNQKSTRTKKKKGKSRQSTLFHQSFPDQFVHAESESQDISGGYSPMDYSPYHEDLVGDQCPREPSVDEREEMLVSAAQRLNIDESNVSQRGERDLSADSACIDEKISEYAKTSDMSKKENEGFSSSARTTSVEAETHESSVNNERQLSEGGPENVGFDSSARTMSMEAEANKLIVNNERQAIEGGPENVGLDGSARTTPMEAETKDSSINNDRQASDGGPEFTFSAYSLEDFGESSFIFNASPFVSSPLSASKHNIRRKKVKSKSCQNPLSATLKGRVPLASPLPDLLPHSTRLPDFVGQKSIPSVPPSEDLNKIRNIKNMRFVKVRRNSFDGVKAQEACEKWRFRGNEAYANGELSKAEDCYTRGINSVSLKEIPRICVQPLTLCFSNRAATRMSLGRMREALSDSKMAVSVNPDFLKAQVRVANCHLALGEIGEALKQFKRCLLWEKDLCTNQKYINEASDGLRKAQQVADLTVQASELLSKKTSNNASQALNVISEALSISPHSESLLEMKAEALLLMRKYEKVIKLCEKIHDLADQNSVTTEAEPQFKNSSPARLWRWRLISKSYFHLGKLEEALEFLQKQEEAEVAVEKYGDRSAESSTSFAVTIRELLRLKSAGNEAFQESRHLEAVEYYSAALACNAESRPFTAVCFCNRAAAYQASGQITDAIADCSLAIALDPSYPKAISRRATLHEMIRDYGQAANDLNRLISLHEKQMEGKVDQSGAVGRTTSTCSDLKRARARLTRVEEEARKGISLNMYIILGIDPSSSAADIKKAYRKAALRHHPDKAGQFLVRNENIDGLWREVASEVHADADRLFKMIGEAYTTLSDPTKRLQYDEEEEIRTTPTNRGYYGSSTSRSSSDTYSSYYEKNVNRHHGRAHGSYYYHRW